jgi:hypothetical protein
MRTHDVLCYNIYPKVARAVLLQTKFKYTLGKEEYTRDICVTQLSKVPYRSLLWAYEKFGFLIFLTQDNYTALSMT